MITGIRSTFALAILSLASSADFPAAGRSAPAGETVQEWLGEYRQAGESITVGLRINGLSLKPEGFVEFTGRSPRIPLAHVTRIDDRLRIEARGETLNVFIDLSVRGDRAKGFVQENGRTGSVVLVRVDPAETTVDEYAGSYRLADGRIVDLGPFDEMGGRLVFLEHGTLQERVLFGLGDDRFAAGAALGIHYPFRYRVRFLRDEREHIVGLEWWEDSAPVLQGSRIAPHRREEVTVRNGEIMLRGVLHLPERAGPHPAVVFAHGSGPTKRNVAFWNMFFVRMGLAVLSLDKRGVGGSTGNWTRASLEDIANDWLAGVQALKHRQDIDPRRIGVHGSSQGGWTGAIMAARSPDVAFLIVRAGSGTSVNETMVYETKQYLRQAGYSGDELERAVGLRRRVLSMLAAGEPYERIRVEIEATNGEPWRRILWPSVPPAGNWTWEWVRLNGLYDSTDPLSSVRCPVLWFLAGEDAHVPTEVSLPRIQAALEKSGNENFTVTVLSGADHGFLRSGESDPDEWWKKTQFADGYFSAMTKWLEQNGFSGYDASADQVVQD